MAAYDAYLAGRLEDFALHGGRDPARSGGDRAAAEAGLDRFELQEVEELSDLVLVLGLVPHP